MCDLLDILPDFDVAPFTHLLYSLQKNDITLAQLITADPVETAKSCPLPLGDLRKLVQAVIEALQKDVDSIVCESSSKGKRSSESKTESSSQQTRHISRTLHKADVIRTLDPAIDGALGGGIHTRYVTEIVGESSAGKTQFVLGLLLSAQLKPPQGLARSAIYISTESLLNTTRLIQMLESHPLYTSLSEADRPSLNNIRSIPVNDLEAQEHIIEYQLQVAVKRFDVGLVVMDSVAANFRAEYETKSVGSMANRALDLAKLGKILRGIAIEDNVAVVVTNQVSDRFDDPVSIIRLDLLRSSSPTLSSPSPGLSNRKAPPSTPAPRNPTIAASMPPMTQANLDAVMTLDHQQRFFTGWGDQPASARLMIPPQRMPSLKNPALGFAWTNQLSARIVLKLESQRVSQRPSDYQGGNIWSDQKRRRFLGIVFAPWVKATVKLVEYEIRREGLCGVKSSEQPEEDEEDQHKDLERGGKERVEAKGKERERVEHTDLLDEKLWGLDGTEDDEEFP